MRVDVTDSRRRYERIEFRIPCRLFIPDEERKNELKFEAYLTSRNLGLGGVFVESTFLLKPDLEIYVELSLPHEQLIVQGRIVHVIALDDYQMPSGMGIEFLDMDSAGREILMRDFTPPRYTGFYDSMHDEFPNITRQFTIEDVSLMLNLWEEWKIVKSGGPLATESGAPTPTPLSKKEGQKRR